MQKNVTLQEVLLIFIYLLPGVLTFSIPMAVLLGILICFGRLSADSEITAMRSSGVAVKDLLLPVITFSSIAFLGLIQFYLLGAQSELSLQANEEQHCPKVH